MADNRKAMDPADIIGKWGLVGLTGGYRATDYVPDGEPYSRFSAEAILYDTEEECQADAVDGEFAEQVVDLWRKKDE